MITLNDAGRFNRTNRAVISSACSGLLASDGSVYCWGSNGSGQCGQNNITAFIEQPRVVVGNHSFISLYTTTAGSFLGLKSNGTVWGWGANTSGQCGDGTATARSSPVSVVGNHSFIKIISSISTYGLKADGTVWAWGVNTYGNLGDNSITNRSSPVSVVGNHSFINISITNSNLAYALKADGSIWSWGYNQYGQLGINTPLVYVYGRSSPVSIVGNISFVDLGGITYSNPYAKTSDNKWWTWGYQGSYYLLGDGTNVDRSSPVLVQYSKFMTANKIAAGNQSVYVADNDFMLFAGFNNNGQLGNNTTTSNRYITYSFRSNAAIAAGFTTAGYIDQNNGVWMWGLNTSGQCGDYTITNRSSPVLVYGTINKLSFKSVIGGGATTTFHAIDYRGKLWGWGSNSAGEVGDNTTVQRDAPVSVAGEHSFTKVAQYNYCLGVKSDGSVWSWGAGTNYRLGHPYSITNYYSPVVIDGTLKFFSFSAIATSNHCLGLLSTTGTVWTWGYNNVGQLGNSIDLLTYSSPISVVGDHSFYKITVLDDSCLGLKTNGTVWGWGNNASGRLGTNNVTNRSSPVSLIGAHSFIQIAGGSAHSAGLKSTGTAWYWGDNSYGQLGDGTATIRSSPVSVVGAHSFIQIYNGNNHSIGLKIDGTAWCWGRNNYGQCGDNSVTLRSSPVSVIGAHSFISVIAGTDFTFGLKTNGTVWAWGNNANGELGDNSIAPRSSPVSVLGAHSFVSITGGGGVLIGRKVDGKLWGCGINNTYLLGDTTNANRSSPVAVISNTSFTTLAAKLNNVGAGLVDTTIWNWGSNVNYKGSMGGITEMANPVKGTFYLRSYIDVGASASASIFLDSSGQCWTIGTNAYGELGDGTKTNRSSPVSVLGAHSFINVYASEYFMCGLKSNGTVWVWGYNTISGVLGDGTSSDRSSPVSVVGAHSFIKVALGRYHATGLKSNGTLWTWGYNTNGQLGDGSVANRSSPVSVIGAHSFIHVFCGEQTTCGVKVDGYVWAWGYNTTYGALGDGTAANRSSPVSVLGRYFASSTAIISSGLNCNYFVGGGVDGLAQDLYVAGSTYGTGNATYTSASSPVAVMGAARINSPVNSIGIGDRHTACVQFDYRGFAWGSNQYGQLGSNTTTDRSSPTSIVGGFSFNNIRCGENHSTSEVINSDPTNYFAYSWGYNTYGQLGDGTANNRSSPVSIVGNHSFIKVGIGANHCFGLKSNGTIWSWGRNQYGQLGDNSITNRSSPVSLVGNFSFVDIFFGASANHSAGLVNNNGVYSIWSWGYNDACQLGNQDVLPRSSPVSIGYLPNNVSYIGTLSSLNSYYIDANKNTYAFGTNFAGSLGNNNVIHGKYPVPIELTNLRTFKKILGSTYLTAALDTENNAFTWGSTPYMPGDNKYYTTLTKSSPVQVISIGWENVSSPNYVIKSSFVNTNKFLDVAAQASYSFWGLKQDGTIWRTCSNANTAVGGVGGKGAASPEILLINSFSSISIYAHETASARISIVGLKDNIIYNWGNVVTGSAGNLDANDTNYVDFTPNFFSANHSFVNITTGYYGLYGIKNTGEIYSIISTGSGSGDLFITSASSSPISVMGGPYDGFAVHQTHAVAAYAVAAWKNNQIWTWGAQSTIPLANGGISYSPSEIMPSSMSFIKIALGGGSNSGLYLDNTGQIWGMGANTSGVLGDGTATAASFLIKTIGNHSFINVCAANTSSYGLKSNGQIWSWGGNTSGVLGDNSATNRSSPVSVIGAHSFVNVFCGSSIGIGLKADGTAWCWGLNTSGQCGDGTATNRSSPVSVVGAHSFIQIAASESVYGLKSNGTLWAWGANATYGALGDNSTSPRSSPVSVVGAHSFINICCLANNAYGLKADGTIWAWGAGSAGYLGDYQSTVNRSSPILVMSTGKYFTFNKVYAGWLCNYGLTSTGAGWAFGSNTNGKLGDNTATNRSSPVSILGAVSFSELYPGVEYCLGKDLSNGWLKAWGLNTNGNLGDNSTTSRSTPINVFYSTSIAMAAASRINASLLLPTGVVWCWGSASFGQCGDNLATNRSSPVSVVGAHSFIKIAMGDQFQAALKSNGTVWVWGLNTSGQCGDNTTNARSSPVSVLGAHSFIDIICNYRTTMGLKSDGSLWGWGSNIYGEIGDGTYFNRSSPVSVVGNYSFVSLIAAGPTATAWFAQDSRSYIWTCGSGNTNFKKPYMEQLQKFVLH